MKSILLVDDHMVVRSGLRAMLNDFYSHVQISEAASEQEALHILRSRKMDLVVLDLQIPNADIIGLIEMISIKYPYTAVLVFSMLSERIYARRVLKAGAAGFLPKDASLEEMKKAFQMTLSNKKYVSPSMMELLAEEARSTSMSNPFEQLSHREFLILNLLLSGNSITSIARQLNIKPSTVGTYKTRIFDKLRIQTVFELKELAALYNLLPYAL